MTDNAEPQAEIAEAATKDKTTEESITTTEAPESEQGASSAEIKKADPPASPAAEGGEQVEEKETPKEQDPPAGESEPNGVANAETKTNGDKQEATSSGPVVSSSKTSRPPYKYDPNKITLRFLFANKDGLTVTVECAPADPVGEVKAALLSVWPEGTIVLFCEHAVACVCLPLVLTSISGLFQIYLSVQVGIV